MSKQLKCLVLYSGGLDSRLACKIMQEQCNIEAIHFILPFVKKNPDNIKFLEQQKIISHIVDCTRGKLLRDYLDLLRHPKHGRGVAMNHCIDCHIFILKLAKEYADKNKIDLIVTGEVLAERPMSQHKKALDIIEEESGLRGRILRPLSARLLPETEFEKQGTLDSTKFFAIHGKSREKQIELANHYKISYPTPAGGCLLCEIRLKEKIKQLLKQKEITQQDINLAFIGNHIGNIILGRNERENLKLEAMKGIKIIPSHPGPTALIKSKSDIKEAERLIQANTKHRLKSFSVKENI